MGSYAAHTFLKAVGSKSPPVNQESQVIAHGLCLDYTFLHLHSATFQTLNTVFGPNSRLAESHGKALEIFLVLPQIAKLTIQCNGIANGRN
jgi:hypothetical protein